MMTDAGLTNGVFYAHFSYKEDLVANPIHAIRGHSVDTRTSSSIVNVVR
jgi:hypothetical protein